MWMTKIRTFKKYLLYKKITNFNSIDFNCKQNIQIFQIKKKVNLLCIRNFNWAEKELSFIFAVLV